MKKGILFALIAVIVFGTSGCFCPPPPLSETDGIANGHAGNSLSFTYTSRHIWRGYDFFPSNTGAFNTSADINLWDSGFRTNVLWTRPVESGYEYWEWLVWDMYYYPEEYFPCCWEDEPYAFQPRIGWRYYYFPDGPLNHCCHHRDLDFQEFYASFYWPRLCCWGIVPYYETAVIWPSEGGRYWDGCPKSYWRTYGGWFHTFGFYKEWEPDIFSSLKPRVRFSYDITYNDGAGPTVDTSKRRADHDLSHSLFKLSTDLKLADNIGLSLGLNYQVSMDQSVNNDDEFFYFVGSRIEF